jgi:hypothetical protein
MSEPRAPEPTAGRTRQDHIAWCKQRAINEMEYSNDPKQGVISMMSDLGKHPETNSETLRLLCMMTLMRPCSMASVRKFIDGFN